MNVLHHRVECQPGNPSEAQTGTRALVVLEQRFERTPDGRVWGPATFAAGFWARYLAVFDRVTAFARLEDVQVPSKRLERCDGADVEFALVPNYRGPWGFLRKWNAIRDAAVAALDSPSSVILRIPSPIGSCVVRHLERVGQPYAVEVVGDPYDVMSPQAFHHAFRPIFRWWLTRQQRNECLAASAAAYVTERTLQKKYPCRGFSVGVSDVELAPFPVGGRRVFTTHYSSVGLTECVASPRTDSAIEPGRIVLISVATLSQMYKGLDVLIDAVAQCVSNGMNLLGVIVGEGRYGSQLQERAAALGIADRIRFTGYLPRDLVTKELDCADIFVLPSFCEGLPRAMIEAMARALPCIGSDVGGIPELLAPVDLVEPGSVAALAARITEVARDGNKRSEMSRRNLAKAHEYLDEVLSDRRRAFYHHVRSVTEQWAGGQTA